MSTLMHMIDEFTKILDSFGFVDDFTELSTARWTSTAADAGASVALDADGVGGIVQLTTGATLNNEAYLESAELFLPKADKPLILLARVNWAEIDTNKANIFVGLMDAPGADSLLDTGAGPKASYSGAGFFKIAGSNKWSVESSNGASQLTSDTDVTAGGGWQTLMVVIQPEDSATARVSFWIDPSGGSNLQMIRPTNSTPREPDITHKLALASLTEMAVCFGAKAGHATSLILNVDIAAVRAKR